MKLNLVVMFLLLAGCDGVFNTNPSDQEPLFTLSVEHSISKISDSATVHLSWDEISVEAFQAFTIERRQKGQSWTKVGSVTNRVVHTYDDVIYDDEDLEYRVGIMDQDGNVRWAEGSTEIPKTTVLFVPGEQPTPAAAFMTPLIDDGDSIVVDTGLYVGHLVLTGKTVMMLSVHGFENTVIQGRVTLWAGVFDGFTVTGNSSLNAGGGIAILGDGIVRRCYVTENTSSRDGGGVLVKDQGSLLNSILFNNFSAYGSHNLAVTGGSGRIINNTIVYTDSQSVQDTNLVNTNITFKDVPAGLLFLNNIVFGADTSLIVDSNTMGHPPVIDYSCMDTSSVTGDHIIREDPQIIGLEADPFNFQLDPASPCIHAGHPDPQYNNRDGTRNTMGAFGGPGGL
jgi:hypothetical protein